MPRNPAGRTVARLSAASSARSSPGALSDKFGRKRLLILSAFLFAVTSLGNALAPTFRDFHHVADARRCGHRAGLESFAHVYRGNCAGADARKAGLHQPAHHRHRDPGGAIDQLVSRAATCPPGATRRIHPKLLVRPVRLALDVRAHRHPFRIVFRRNVFRSRKPALAGKKRQSRKMPAAILQKSAAERMRPTRSGKSRPRS